MILPEIDYVKLYDALSKLEPYHWASMALYGFLFAIIWYFLVKYDK